MNRRDFLKSAALLTAAGAMLGKGSVLKAAEAPAAKPTGPVLNFNPQMQYRPMGRTGVNVSALGFGLLRLPDRLAALGNFGNEFNGGGAAGLSGGYHASCHVPNDLLCEENKLAAEKTTGNRFFFPGLVSNRG